MPIDEASPPNYNYNPNLAAIGAAISANVGGQVGGQAAHSPLVREPSKITHGRRVELLSAVQEISRIFDRYQIVGEERCLVGRLCQEVFQFRNFI